MSFFSSLGCLLVSFLILLCKEIDTILTDYAPTIVEKETLTIETLFLIMSVCACMFGYMYL